MIFFILKITLILVTLSIVNEKNGNSRRSSAAIMSEKFEFLSCETSKISQFSPKVAFIQEVSNFFEDTRIAQFFPTSSVILPKASGRIFFAENFWIDKIALKTGYFKMIKNYTKIFIRAYTSNTLLKYKIPFLWVFSEHSVKFFSWQINFRNFDCMVFSGICRRTETFGNLLSIFFRPL